MSEPTSQPSGRPPGFFREIFDWFIIILSANPGYSPWEKQPRPPKFPLPPDNNSPPGKP